MDYIIFLWLNDNHYNLILLYKTFSEKNLCKVHELSYSFVFSDSHVCKNNFTCLKCFSQNCEQEINYKKECGNCNVVFRSSKCFNKHISNAFLKSKLSHNSELLLSPCQYMHYCKECERLFRDFFGIKE